MPCITLRYGCMFLLTVAGLVSAQIAGPITAPFTQLTATDDGQQVYFTSTLQLKATPGRVTEPEGRLYRLGPDGVSLFAERGALAAFPSGGPGILKPQVSGDGMIVGFTFLYICKSAGTSPTTGCTPVPNEGVLRGKQNLDLGPGSVQLSRNGRWALLTPPVDFTLQTATLIDLSTAQRNPVPLGPVEGASPSIASDGTVLVEERGDQGQGTNQFRLWKEGVSTPIAPDPDYLRAAALSDNARVLLLSASLITQPFLGATTMAVRDLQTGHRTVLFSSPDRSEVAVFLGISNDGKIVLYERAPAEGPFNGTAYVANTTTGENLQIGLPPGEMVVDGTLSGSGELAFLVTTSGRLVRVAWLTSTVTSVLPATPYINDLFGLVPGSFFRLRGSVTGSPADWLGRILLDGQSVPVIYARTGEVAIQVPWERGVGPSPFRLDMSGDSPFQQVQTVTIYQQSPLPLAVIRGDWSGLLDRPPGPGDIVHMYMTGLGPVNGPFQTGIPASLVTLNPIQGTIKCGFNIVEDLFATNAETLFAGLAPGTIGVYQVSVRLPAQVHDTIAAITCILTGKNGEESTLIWGLTLP